MNPSLREELKREVDATWSEVVRILPLQGGIQDPDRSPAELRAVLRTGEREVERFRLAGRNGSRTGASAGGGVLRVDRSANPDLVLRKHDKVVALSRPGQPMFEVLEIDDRTHLRLIAELGDV